MTTVLSAQDLAALREFDTPTICNVIELFNVRPRNTGYMNHHIKACFPKMPPMVGFALTSTFRSMAAPRGGDVYASIVKQLDMMPSLAGPSVVTFQDLDEPTAAATFGEVMCSTYKAFGSAGLITSGTGRDLDQVERLGYPVFTGGANCSHGYCHIISVGVPVSVGGITVFQGDLLHGDLNGVTTIPIEIARAIPQGCRELATAENIVLDYLKTPNLTPKGLDDARKACGDAINQLGKRLRGEK